MKPALPLQQHPTFGAALSLMGADIRRIDIGGTSPTQIIKRFGINFAPRCHIAGEQADTLRSSTLRIINAETAGTAYRQAGFRQIMTAASVAELDLTKPAQPRAKWRHSLHKSHILNISHAVFDGARHQWLLDHDRAQQRAKGYRALPHNLIHAFAASSPRDVVVFSAIHDDTPVAAMLFLKHAPVATYHIGWTNDDGRKMAAHHALLMQAADHFATCGFTRLDLGTIDTENAPGLARFKIGSGANIRVLGGTWLRVPGF